MILWCLISGKRFGYNNTWYLSSNSVEVPLNYQEIVTAKFPTISAYRLPETFVNVYSDNVATISISSGYMGTGTYTLVTANSAGWTKMNTDLVVI